MASVAATKRKAGAARRARFQELFEEHGERWTAQDYADALGCAVYQIVSSRTHAVRRAQEERIVEASAAARPKPVCFSCCKPERLEGHRICEECHDPKKCLRCVSMATAAHHKGGSDWWRQ